MLQTPPEHRELDILLEAAAETFDTPCYVYLTDVIEQRIAHLRAQLGQWFDLSYAMKCNPNPGLLKWLERHVDLIDVSSIGEFKLATDAGWPASRASFTGPGKRKFEIAQAIERGIGELVIENPREARIANDIAAASNQQQDILIRLSPSRVPKGFGDQMAGRPSPFGFDVETAREDIPAICELSNLNLVGLHIYSGTQCLKPEAICENYRGFMSVFSEICDAHDITPQRLVFGSGLGVPYHETDTPLDLSAVASGMTSDMTAFRANPRFAKTKLILELGRYLVGEAGYFLTRVVALKSSRGQKIAICDGGMNNHLPASGHFGMVIHRNYRMHVVNGTRTTEKINIVGPLCTSIDRLANGVELPAVSEGDIVAVHNSGAYGLTASPMQFISHPHPKEILAEAGNMTDVSTRF